MIGIPFCTGCKAPVHWIKTSAGKKMICNPKLVESDGRLGLTLILENGVTVRNPQAGLRGFIPHWATCPQASKFKRKP